MRATRSDDSDEWASRSAQDDNRPVILKREALKNPGRRRTRSGRRPGSSRASTEFPVLRTGSFADAQDDSATVILRP